MKFKLKAKKADGEVKEMTRDAVDKFALFHELKTEGLTVVSTEELGDGKENIFSRLAKVDLNHLEIPLITGIKQQDKILFAKNLSSMLAAGLPMSRCLAVMEKQTKNYQLKMVLAGIDEDIKKGTALNASMKRFPKVFNKLFVSMTAAGEESGKLADALEIVGSQMEKTYLLQGKIKGALIYPGVIFTAMIGVAVLMMIYVVPTLTSTFIQLKVNLPVSTQIIIFISNVLQNYSIEILVGVALIIAALYWFSKTRVGMRSMDWSVLHIPIITPLVKETNSARTARTFSSLIASGVAVVDALVITEDVVQNSYYKEVIQKARKKIQVGQPIAEIFSAAENLYPPFVGEMIAVGEETGQLSLMLLKVATFYENEVEQKTKDMSTIIEPFLMVVIGAAVGFFAISMIGPTYSLVDSV